MYQNRAVWVFNTKLLTQRLPESKRSVVAKAGALTRLPRFTTLQRASQLALLGDFHTAEEMKLWGFVNWIVDDRAQLLPKAYEIARIVIANSPDSIIVSRTAFLHSLEHGSLERYDRGSSNTKGNSTA